MSTRSTPPIRRLESAFPPVIPVCFAWLDREIGLYIERCPHCNNGHWHPFGLTLRYGHCRMAVMGHDAKRMRFWCETEQLNYWVDTRALKWTHALRRAQA